MKINIEDDFIAGKEVEDLVKRFDIKLIIETGTYHARTALMFSNLAQVWSVEINPENFAVAKKNVDDSQTVNKVSLFQDNSVDFLNSFLKPGKIQGRNVLFFLDAHWYDYCPLLDELKVIAKSKMKPVIVIHDFMVPGTDFGYDSYDGKPFSFELIQSSLEQIYGIKYGYYYNTVAEGARRGLIYIYPEDIE